MVKIDKISLLWYNDSALNEGGINVKGIKGFRPGRRLLALIMAGTMAFSLSGCDNGTVEMDSLTTSQVLNIDDVKDVTLIDELIESGKLRFDNEMTIVDAADQLERYMDISDHLKSLDFTGVTELRPLTEEEYEAVLTLSMDDIDLLVEDAKYDGKDLLKIEQKLTALKELEHLYTYCTTWAHNYGKNISLSMMMAAVKGSVADELDIPVESYATIKIPANTSNTSDGPKSYYVKVDETYYEVPMSAEEIWNTIGYIYTLQSSNLPEENEFPTYRKALNYAKTTMAAGASLKNKKLEEQYDASYIKENYVK